MKKLLKVWNGIVLVSLTVALILLLVSGVPGYVVKIFFYPIMFHTLLITLFYGPYLWYLAHMGLEFEKNRTDLKFFSVILGIIPGIIIYNQLADHLGIPGGAYAILGYISCGVLYLQVIASILKDTFKKSFTDFPVK